MPAPTRRRARSLPFAGRRRTSPKGGNRVGLAGVAREALQLWRFEGSAALPRRRFRRVAMARAGSTAPIDIAACPFVMGMPASIDVEAEHDAAVRYREAAMESGQRRDSHAAARNGGGARIDCARANTSTTRMAAPQCGQTKIAEAIVVEACCVEGASASGTCSSSRARARCSRRPALASNP